MALKGFWKKTLGVENNFWIFVGDFCFYLLLLQAVKIEKRFFKVAEVTCFCRNTHFY